MISVLSGGGNQRPFSPFRLAPTMGPTVEDLIYAAARGRALPIPEADEQQSTEGPPSVRHSKAPSAVPSRLSHVPSQGNKATSHVSAAKVPSVALSQVSDVRPPSVALSKQSRGSKIDRESNITPTPARPRSPIDLDQEEAKIVEEALAGKTPRTSYYASTAPLDPDMTNHFHDLELCVLLQEENDTDQHEYVKRALRKAIKQRIKRLGMKYDNEVRPRHFSFFKR